MTYRRKKCMAALIAVLACSALAAAPAAAKTRVVHHGQSIQKAIDASKPGDTVLVRKGTYRESLQISTDRLTLRGVHATLEQPASPAQTLCNQMAETPGQATGICIVGQVTPPSTPSGAPTVNRQVRDVRVTGFTVQKFTSDGVFIFGSKGAVLQNDRLIGNGGYGVFSNTSTGTQYLRDLAKGNHAPGFYVGDSPKARSYVHQVRSLNNAGEGILLRDASFGRVTDNIIQGNCAGIAVLAHTPPPTAAGHWKISGNRVLKNNKACAGDPADGEPPVSGVGIALLGGDNNLISLNQVLGNKAGHPSGIGNGGIVIQKAPDGTASTSNTILSNTATGNTPFDISWDGAGSNKFTTNHCTKGKPARVCKH